MNIIDEKWEQLTSFNGNKELKQQLLHEVKSAYSTGTRAYHNLHHISFMLQLCDEYLGELNNPVVVAFATFYHDVVYDTNRRDNEEKSAAFAKKQLQALMFKRSLAAEVEKFILATIDHNASAKVEHPTDLEFFLDFDLAVLGLPAEQYQHYTRAIRQEYLQYRTPIYREGRRQAMTQLLSQEKLFHTQSFRERCEEQARLNINNELAELNN